MVGLTDDIEAPGSAGLAKHTGGVMVVAVGSRTIGRAGLNRLKSLFPKAKFDFDLFPKFGVSPSHPN